LQRNVPQQGLPWMIILLTRTYIHMQHIVML
jgi:hypothetical protein